MNRFFLVIVVGLCASMGVVRAQDRDAPVIFPQLGHSGAVNAVAFSRDGTRLASASTDGTIKFWDLASGREIRTLNGHADAVASLAFAPNGKMLVSVSRDRTIKLWDAANGRELRSLNGDIDFESVRFTADGKVIVAAGNPNPPSSERGVSVAIQRWDAASGRRLPAPTGSFVAAAVSADGTRIGAIDFRGSVTLWDAESGRELRVLKGFGRQFEIFTLSPDGKTLITSDFDGSTKFWDATSGHLLRTWKAPGGSVTFIDFSLDGAQMASGGGGETITLWDVAEGRVARMLSANSHYGNAHFTSAIFSGDGKQLASGNADGTISLWDVASGRELQTLTRRAGFVRSIALSPDGRLLGTGSADGVEIFDAASGQELHNLSGPSNYGVNDTSAVTFLPDGKTLASLTDPGIVLWDTARGAATWTSRGNYEDAIAASPDGRLLATYGVDDDVLLLNVSDGSAHLTLNIGADVNPSPGSVMYIGGNAGPSNGCGSSLAFSPDGKSLAVASYFKIIGLWDVASGRELQRLSGDFNAACSVAFSPDGKTLATGTSSGSLLWDVASGRPLRALKESSSRSFVAFSPDGALVASGGANDTIGLWDVATGRELRSFSGHTGLVTSAVFSTDEKMLISGSNDGTTRIWDVATGKERVSLIVFDDGSHIAITPEGFFDSSSAQAEENLNVRVGNQVSAIASYRDKFYRPDLVKLSLAGQSLGRLGSIDAVKPAPLVAFVDVPASTGQQSLKVNLRITDHGGGIGIVQVFRNGTQIIQDSTAQQTHDGGSVTRTYAIALVNGRNELSATASNADWSHSSNDATAVTNANLSSPPPPTFHAVVVGIQSFADSNDNLKYSVADAEFFAANLEQYTRKLFEKRDIKLLTKPAETDKVHLTQTLEAMRSSVGPNDEFVFYVASHGVVIAGQYYLITSNASLSDAEHAISSSDLTALVGNIQAGKKLVVIDTCDSAALAEAMQASIEKNQGMTAQVATTILANDSRMAVFAAADSDETAQEGYQGHGLFTYVVVQGLSGQDGLFVNSAVDKDGTVNTSGLGHYVTSEVPPLALKLDPQHPQHPTAIPSKREFPITEVR